MNHTDPHPFPSRRQFIHQSSLAVAAAALPLSASGAPEDITSRKIRLGLIGCGGRGSGAAAQALTADSNSQLWAMGDVFREQIDKSLSAMDAQFKETPGRVSVAEERKFVGLDAYQKVLA